jgi:hypothetical protein
MAIHLIKLCVGCDTIEELQAWQRTRTAGADWRVHTRHTPKRAEELLEGGSLYRVFKGSILCRQRVLAIETVGAGQAKRCEIVLDPEIVRVAPVPRRPFQGWRYLNLEEAPADLPRGAEADLIPVALASRLRELGAW